MSIWTRPEETPRCRIHDRTGGAFGHVTVHASKSCLPIRTLGGNIILPLIERGLQYQILQRGLIFIEFQFVFIQLTVTVCIHIVSIAAREGGQLAVATDVHFDVVTRTACL